MTENKRYCMNCMKEIDENTVFCPHCQYDSGSVQHEPSLPKETVIADRYLIGKVTSIANDSITYIGRDFETDEIVDIQEFYPTKIVRRNENKQDVMVMLGCDAMYRNCLNSFINLWKSIGAINNEPALPLVKNILDFNGTVYVVCKHLDSITLKSYFEETDKPLTWKGVTVAFRTLLSAVRALHKAGVIHGSISPTSVHVGLDKKLHLTNFMIPQCRSQAEALKVPPVQGFSAIEIYSSDNTAKEYSDVYSVMALIYYSITGIIPQKATERATRDEMVIPSSVAGTLDKSTISAIAKGLAVYPANRYQTMEELIAALLPSAAAPIKAAQPAKKQESAADDKKEAPVIKKSQDKPVKKASSDKSNASLFTLGFGTFAAVVILCMVVFSILYTTTLYKSYDIPLLNNIFSSWTFLPMNKTEQVNTEPEITTTEYNKNENTYVTVPDFSVHTHDSIVTNETFNTNFKFEFVYEFSDTVEKNGVVSQSIPKNESVLAGTTITIVISQGIEQIELPDVIGLEFSEAKKILEDSFFVIKTKYIRNDGTHKDLTVATMDKVAGLSFDKGTEITLTIYEENLEDASKEGETTKPQDDGENTNKPVSQDDE